MRRPLAAAGARWSAGRVSVTPTPNAPGRLTHARFAAGLSSTALSLGVAACLAFSIGLLATRTLLGGEGELLFEASRLRSHLALYVDPVIGAFDYGPVPSRYYVLYPPLWSSVLSLLPVSAALVAGRAVCTALWFGTVALVAFSASADRRKAAMAGAAFVAGQHTLALFATSLRPDAVAIALATFALVRSVRKQRVDAVAGALFTLAAFVKPNVFGMAAGAFAVELGNRPRRAFVPITACLVVTAFCVSELFALSNGTWTEHLLRSTGQRASLSLWLERVSSRVPFFALPIATVWLSGWGARKEPGVRVALSAFVVSLGWALLSLCKTGSASHYWLEPCVAGLVVIASAGLPSWPTRVRVVAPFAWAAQCVWSAVFCVPGVVEAFEREPARADLIARSRSLCGLRDRDVVAADDAGPELSANGRVLTPMYQMTNLVRQHRYPVSTLVEDLLKPEVAAFVMRKEAPTIPFELADDDPLKPLSDAIRTKFTAREEVANWVVMCARSP